MAPYTISYEVEGTFGDTVEAVVAALGEEGFGVLSDIDVQATLREKLDVDFRQYRILGACNPPLAREAMRAEPELGALLPCNVIVYENDAAVRVSAVDPERLLAVADNDDLTPIATEVRERLTAALDAVPGATRIEA